MVNMDVCQYNVADIFRLCSGFGQRFEQSLCGNGRSGVDYGLLPIANKIAGYKLAVTGYGGLQVKQFQIGRYICNSDAITLLSGCCLKCPCV